MKKSVKYILFSFITLILILTILILTGVIKGYYYKTDMKIGDYTVYDYKYITPVKCKCIDIAVITEDDDKRYIVQYTYNIKGPYIKYKGEYLKLDEAIEKGLITTQDVILSDVEIKIDLLYK